jgi:hypothetical protein
MSKIKSLLIVVIISSLTLSQTDNNKLVMSGNLSTDAKTIMINYFEPDIPQFSFPASNKKSPVLAGALSLLVPGAGEIYAEEYLKAGIFIALEAAVITTAVIYDNKGDTKTNEFQDYADDYKSDPATGHYWSVIKYAQWLIDNKQADPNIIISNDPNLPPWEQVNWSLLNDAENGHRLPSHGEQQYYELIGKYPQYSPGWNDFNSNDYHDVSSNFLFYSTLRGDANDLYAVASTAVIGIYINHFLSALDAVWSTSQYNKDLAVKFRLENLQFTDHAEFYPKVYLTYTF